MDVSSKILQESIINISPQVFLNRLVLFNLISDKEYETLRNSTAEEQQQNSNNQYSILTTFVIQKLQDETVMYHERFKMLLICYKDLTSMYRTWDTLCKSHSLKCDKWIVQQKSITFIGHYSI